MYCSLIINHPITSSRRWSKIKSQDVKTVLFTDMTLRRYRMLAKRDQQLGKLPSIILCVGICPNHLKRNMGTTHNARVNSLPYKKLRYRVTYRRGERVEIRCCDQICKVKPQRLLAYLKQKKSKRISGVERVGSSEDPEAERNIKEDAQILNDQEMITKTGSTDFVAKEAKYHHTAAEEQSRQIKTSKRK